MKTFIKEKYINSSVSNRRINADDSMIVVGENMLIEAKNSMVQASRNSTIITKGRCNVMTGVNSLVICDKNTVVQAGKYSMILIKTKDGASFEKFYIIDGKALKPNTKYKFNEDTKRLEVFPRVKKVITI